MTADMPNNWFADRIDELIRAVDEIFIGKIPSEDDLYGMHQVLVERRDAELDRQSVTDDAVQNMVQTFESFLSSRHDANWVGDTVSNQYLCDSVQATLRQMGSTKPCEWCDKDGPETWNYTRSGKYIPEYQTPRNYCRACGRPLKGGE